MKRAARAFALGLMLAGLALAVACGKDGVVGGDCVSGYAACDGRCVDLDQDAVNCGRCGNECGAGSVCRGGECEASGGSGAGGDSSGGNAGEAGANSGIGGSRSGSGGTNNGGAGGSGGSATTTDSGSNTGMGGMNAGTTSPSGTSADGSSSSTGGVAGTGSGGVGGVGVGGTPNTTGAGGVTGVGGATGTGGATATTTTTTTTATLTGSTGTGTGTGGMGGVGGSTGVGGMGGVGGVPCLAPYNTPGQCGDCDTVCSGSTPLCAADGLGSYECVPSCDLGLTVCSGQCVDLNTDPQHCGSCDNACPSGVCVDALCLGTTAGHIVYVCMNYEQVFQASTQTTLLGNAVFLPRRDPVRVLAYTQYAENAVVASTDRAIRWAGTRINRTAVITHTSSLTDIESGLTLANYDVFLVYDQALAPSGALATAGAELAATLDTFTAPGGVAVVLSGATGVAEMPEFASSANLVSAIGELDYTDELAYVQASGDVVGFGLLTPFLTLPSSCTVQTSDAASSNFVFVVTDTAPADGVGNPVVVHRIVTP